MCFCEYFFSIVIVVPCVSCVQFTFKIYCTHSQICMLVVVKIALLCISVDAITVINCGTLCMYMANFMLYEMCFFIEYLESTPVSMHASHFIFFLYFVQETC
jgi:hypothetical protein